MKKCSRCKHILSIDNFSKDKGQKSGLKPECNKCRNDFYLKNIDKRKKYLLDNHEEICFKAKERYNKNRRREIDRVLKYNKDNWNKILEYNRKYYDKKIKNNIFHKLNRSIRTKMVRTLHNGSKNRQKWELLVGYTVQDLKKHLEKQFKNGMTWDNYGKWHIDHIKPISKFKYNNPVDIDFKECWSLSNLQPLWAKENISKGASF
jgi:hypothetical protein